MQSQSNTVATISLVCGVLTWVLFFGGLCVSFVPFIGFLGVFLIMADWVLAFIGLILGIVGWRMASSLGGAGSASGIIGAVLNGSWLLMQVLGMALAFLLIGGGTLMVLLLALIGGAQ